MKHTFTKHFLIILSIFVSSSSFAQVDNYDLLTKNIESSNIKTITKFHKSKKYPNGKKEFKLEFNKEGRLVSIEEYEFPIGPDNPIVMRQEIHYNHEGKKVATHIKSPDGSTAIDTLIYDEQARLIKKQRISNGQIVKTWDYSDKKENSVQQKEFDNDGKLIKLKDSNEDYIIYQYDSNGNLTQEIEYREGKEHTKHTFKYDANNRLTNIETYLLYIGAGTNDPLTYYFEYEVF